MINFPNLILTALLNCLSSGFNEGNCYASGDPHYVTFDGKRYNFMGACRYVHVTDYCNVGGGKSALGQFKVIAANYKCGGSVSCIDYVDVIIGGKLHEREPGFEL